MAMLDLAGNGKSLEDKASADVLSSYLENNGSIQ